MILMLLFDEYVGKIPDESLSLQATGVTRYTSKNCVRSMIPRCDDCVEEKGRLSELSNMLYRVPQLYAHYGHFLYSVLG